jgi:DNA-binding beta-propeller fold protein YncE
VADTGNKRVVVFGPDGSPLGQFGGFGLELGGLDEPVGIAIDRQGRVYVADTWNRRVQVFEEVSQSVWTAVAEWPIEGWFGQSLENKPYLAVSRLGTVCVSDPEGYRVLCFTPEGEFVLGWGGFGSSAGQFASPVGLGFTSTGDLWVVDSGNDRLMRFDLPEAG